MGTHDTEYHNDRKPSVKPKVEVKAPDEYKANTAYFDTGANKQFFKHKPDQYRPYAKPAYVTNANGVKDAVLGSETVRLGKLKLNDVQYVPNFQENLVSNS